MDPRHLLTLVALGTLHKENKNSNKAIEYFKKALEIDQQNICLNDLTECIIEIDKIK